MGDVYTSAAKVQEWGLLMVTYCFGEATCTSAELAELQNLERGFMDRVVDHFGHL